MHRNLTKLYIVGKSVLMLIKVHVSNLGRGLIVLNGVLSHVGQLLVLYCEAGNDLILPSSWLCF